MEESKKKSIFLKCRYSAKGLSIRYILALSIIGTLSFSGFIVVQKAIQLQEKNGLILNITSRQRVLAENISLFVEQINSENIINKYAADDVNVPKREPDVTAIESSIKLMLNAHEAIINNDIDSMEKILQVENYENGFEPMEITQNDKFIGSDEIYNMYYNKENGIIIQMDDFLTKAHTLSKVGEIIIMYEVISKFKEQKKELVSAYDKLLLQLQKENESDIAKLKNIEKGVFIFTLLILFIEALLIFRPMVKNIITNQRNLEKANTELEQANRTKDEFLHIATHELRSPLTSIRGYLSMILDGDTGPITDITKDFLSKVYKSSERQIELINEMLDLNKIEQGKMEFVYDKFNFKAMLDEAKEDIIQYGKERNVGAILEADYDNLEINSDESKLRQVYMNLLSNASKFSPEGSNVIIKSYIEGDKVITSVIDQGIGIKTENIDKIFEKFGQVESAQKKGIKGTGLGLPIVKMIVENLGGEIKVTSEEGKGSIFTTILPL